MKALYLALMARAIAVQGLNPSMECISIVALASTRDPDYAVIPENIHSSSTINATGGIFEPTFDAQDYPEQETFECLLPSGLSIPITGTETQLNKLRHDLNKGALISGENTLDGLRIRGVDDSTNHLWENTTSSFTAAIKNAVVTLPAGEWNFEPTPSRYRRHLTSRNNRRLASYEGIKKVLVVRIIDKNGLVNPDAPSFMSDKIFGTYGDKFTMSSQYEACSFGKMKITNDYGFNVDQAAPGVVEVQVDFDLTTSNLNSVRNEFRIATEAKIGRSLPDHFDHVLFVVEQCYVDCGWAGFATVNGWVSVYHKHHYSSMAVTLHEVGHNLNLAHSGGVDGKEYTDHSCLMGNPWFKDDRGQMCFNPAKTWQIASAGAWYDEKYMLTWESGKVDPKYWRVKLVGIADYNMMLPDAALVVKLETGFDKDLFVGFNRATGINIDSKDGNDKVTIIEAGNNGKGYSKSIMVDELGSGEHRDFVGWRGSGKSLVIRVLNIVKTSSPWYAEVEFNFNNATVPSASPSMKPTGSVSPPPSNQPVQSQPSPSPTFVLTGSPTYSLSPTMECGDLVCMPYETNLNCPNDCIGNEFATYDDNIGAKGANGTIFSLQAVRDVAITSISTFFRSDTESLVQVYTKTGSYRGFEQNQTEWTLIYDKTVKQNGKDVVTHLGSFTNNVPVVIAAGEIRSFYVYSPSNLVYRQENAVLEGDMVKSDNSLNFYAGIAVAYGLFGSGQVFGPRIFSGVLWYDGIKISQPTSSPVMSANCWLLNSQDECLQNSMCRWLAFGDGICRRKRMGKASKRTR